MTRDLETTSEKPCLFYTGKNHRVKLKISGDEKHIPLCNA